VTTKKKETKQHIHPKHKKTEKKLPQLTKQTAPLWPPARKQGRPCSYSPAAHIEHEKSRCCMWNYATSDYSCNNNTNLSIIHSPWQLWPLDWTDSAQCSSA